MSKERAGYGARLRTRVSQAIRDAEASEEATARDHARGTAALALLPEVDAALAGYFRHQTWCGCRMCSLRRRIGDLLAEVH